MKLFHDRQTRHYLFFLFSTLVLLSALFLALSFRQDRLIKDVLLSHDGAILSALLEQGVPEAAAVKAVTASGPSSVISPEGNALMEKIGRTAQTSSRYLPAVRVPLQSLNRFLLLLLALMTVLLLGGSLCFLTRRERLYRQAVDAVAHFTAGDYSVHLPRTEEGTLHLLFSSIDRLAMALCSQTETEHRTKEFLKDTISDISHQLKTPLAAMTMYSEIIAAEPDHPDTVSAFTGKMHQSLNRMEQLIASLLKITRLDAGNITFEFELHPIREVVEHAIQDLNVRAHLEEKELILEGGGERLLCDFSWTAEAFGNLVKNALDHTGAGGIIRISWESSPSMVRILVADNGCGIASVDLHHIFKRFYRSQHSLDTQGVGLGLPLAKSILEEQGGVITVTSTEGVGTTFTISFLTKL